MIDIKYDGIVSDNYYSETEGYKYSGYIVENKTKEGFRSGYINYKGQEILKPEYNKVICLTQIEEDANRYLIFEKNGKAGLKKNKETVLKNEYQSIEYDELNQLFVIERNKKYGVVDKNAKSVIPVEYDNILIDGIYIYASVGENQTVFLTNGKEEKTPKYKTRLETNSEEYYIVIDDENNQGIIDKTGKEIIPNDYLYVEYLFDHYFIVCDYSRTSRN